MVKNQRRKITISLAAISAFMTLGAMFTKSYAVCKSTKFNSYECVHWNTGDVCEEKTTGRDCDKLGGIE